MFPTAALVTQFATLNSFGETESLFFYKKEKVKKCWNPAL